MSNFTFAEWIEPEPDHQPTRHPLKCGVCGRFTKRLTLVWTRGPEPEPDYEVGDCCRK